MSEQLVGEACRNSLLEQPVAFRWKHRRVSGCSNATDAELMLSIRLLQLHATSVPSVYPHLVVARQEDVLRLEVAVQDARAVQLM